MSNTAQQEPSDTTDQIDAGIESAQYIENSSRYDGSRTPPQKIALVHALKREGRSVNAICQILSMSPMTVKAVLARQDDLITDARMLLKANALGFAGDAILASAEAAKKGKIEGISAMLDRLGVTEPPKNQAQTNIGVQVILHGGAVPLELSPAKVPETSETLVIQAQSEPSLISPVMDAVSIEPQGPIEQALTVSEPAPTVTQDAQPVKPRARKARGATNVAGVKKQAKK